MRDGFCHLGSPILGAITSFNCEVQLYIENVRNIQESIIALDEPQTALHILRSSLEVCKVNHLLQSVPRVHLMDSMESFNEYNRNTLSELMNSTVSDRVWYQATLPFRLRGLELQKACDVRIGFIASSDASKE